MTVGEFAECAKAAGMQPSVLIERLLRCLEDGSLGSAKRSA
jgi:hypothetical protein